MNLPTPAARPLGTVGRAVAAERLDGYRITTWVTERTAGVRWLAVVSPNPKGNA